MSRCIDQLDITMPSATCGWSSMVGAVLFFLDQRGIRVDRMVARSAACRQSVVARVR